ncbi:hypothetical protein MTO96_021777 [Rhipicephalus appendiculatus]
MRASHENATCHICYRFSKEPDLRRKWISAVRRDPTWAPSKSTVVCSEHFTARDFMTGIKAVGRLKPKAVPSLGLTEMAAPESRDYMALLREGPAVADSGTPAVPYTAEDATMQLAPQESHEFIALLGEGPAVADSGTPAVPCTAEDAAMQESHELIALLGEVLLFQIQAHQLYHARRKTEQCSIVAVLFQLAPQKSHEFIALLGEGPAVADSGTPAVPCTTEDATMQNRFTGQHNGNSIPIDCQAEIERRKRLTRRVEVVVRLGS